MLKIQTREQLLAHHCASYELGYLEDSILQQQVITQARACPYCGHKPNLFAHAMYIHGYSRTRKIYTAAQLLCGCGRASQLFDVRDKANEGCSFDDSHIPHIQRVCGDLIQHWNR